MTRLMKMNSKEWHYILIGCISALAQGGVQPAFALIFGIMLGVSKLSDFVFELLPMRL